VLGVDRLDYSKGLANRVRAFDRMLEFEPGLKRAVALLQVAAPSRSNIRAYRELKAELAALVGEVNARHGEADWLPVRYINKGYAQSALAGFYRLAHVGLVTPLHDGMNLVAKEYVAAQNPFDPGVLVLSSFAGAAQQLDAALMVNPHDVDDLARQIANALAMSLEERRRRWQSMVSTLRISSLQKWYSDFVRALAAARRSPPRLPISRPAALPPVAVAGAGRTTQLH
jgi:trehalose 6-phosphate synthase